MVAPVRLRITVVAAAASLAAAHLCAQEPLLSPRAAAEVLASPEATAARVLAGPVLSAAKARTPVASHTVSSKELAFPRVRRAYAAKRGAVRSLFTAAGVTRPAAVFFRVFKRERVLEVWARGERSDAFVLLKRYPICRISGRPGPKRQRGDLQVPEGFYTLDLFNPVSRFLLSMRVSYPNAVDRARGRGRELGGDIYIHGGCASIGCIAVGDEWIQELYVIALEARDAGQRRIPVHVFPTRLDDRGMLWLARTYTRRYVDYPFWQSLQAGYLAFERAHRLPDIREVDGRYVLGDTADPLAGAPLGKPALAAASTALHP